MRIVGNLGIWWIWCVIVGDSVVECTYVCVERPPLALYWTIGIGKSVRIIMRFYAGSHTIRSTGGYYMGDIIASTVNLRNHQKKWLQQQGASPPLSYSSATPSPILTPPQLQPRPWKSLYLPISSELQRLPQRRWATGRSLKTSKTRGGSGIYVTRSINTIHTMVIVRVRTTTTD